MNTNSDHQKPKGLYWQIGEELKDRTCKPWKHPSFVLFFFYAVLGFSALGIWVELYAYIYPGINAPRRTDALRAAIVTFFPAVAGTAAMQLIWAESGKHVRSVAFSILGTILVIALWISPARISNASALAVGILASIFALWVWWIANARQLELLDVINAAAPVGGDDVMGKLPGTLEDYKY